MGEAVADGDGAAGQQQLHGHRATDDIGGADDYSVHAVQVLTGALQQGHDAFWRAGAQKRNALGQAADVVGVETVDVFIWADAFEQQRGIQMLRKWQLQENAVDGRIVVEAVDQVGQGLLRSLAGQVESLGNEADLFAVLALVRNIDLGSRVGTDQITARPGVRRPCWRRSTTR